MAPIFHRALPLLLVFGAFLSTGCPSVDDGDTDVVQDTDVTPAPPQTEDGIHGTWVSEGDDLSGLFSFTGVARVDATFNADGSYSATSTDDEGATTDFTGTYSVDVSSTPPGIVLDQATPYVGVAEGIWQVEADGSLTYEVIQTTPDLGFAPPTPEGGFGSSSGPGLASGANVQTYR